MMYPQWEYVAMPFLSLSLLLVAVTDNCRIYPNEGGQMNIGKTHSVSMMEEISAS
jgi:hypothetical protein